MSSLFLLWWMFFSAFPGESRITGTRSSKRKTAAGGDSYGTGGSHAEWPSPHRSGELYHSPADCPTQGKCNTTRCVSCVKIPVVILGKNKVCPSTVQLWSSECVFPVQELLQQSASLKVQTVFIKAQAHTPLHAHRWIDTSINTLKQIVSKWFGCQKL